MKVVLDTNIIFSSLINSNGTIGAILFNSNDIFEFYSCSYMRYEIDKQWEKLKKISKLSEQELLISKQLLFSKIKFINESLIPEKIWLQAEKLTKDIDEDDIDFIALSLFLKAKLWTGDKVLQKGLNLLGYKQLLNTEEINIMFLKKLKA